VAGKATRKPQSSVRRHFVRLGKGNFFYFFLERAGHCGSTRPTWGPYPCSYKEIKKNFHQSHEVLPQARCSPKSYAVLPHLLGQTKPLRPGSTLPLPTLLGIKGEVSPRASRSLGGALFKKAALHLT